MNDLDETAGVVPDEYVKAFFEDDAINTAVSDLVNQFNSAKLHPSNMDENISIAQATAYAAQTRSSFIIFCTQLWKATWGEALVGRGGKSLEVEDFPSHRDVWDVGWLSASVNVGDEKVCIGVMVDDTISLQSYTYGPKHGSKPTNIENVEPHKDHKYAWKTGKVDGEHNASYDIGGFDVFCEHPAEFTADMRGAAKALVASWKSP